MYDLGDDFGENMDLMIYGMDGEVPVGIYDGECKIDFEEIVNSVCKYLAHFILIKRKNEYYFKIQYITS